MKSLAIRDFVLRKKTVSMARDYLMKQSTEKSADRRNGEILAHMDDMETDLSISDAFLKDVENKMDDIAHVHESLSRQITCIQERNRDLERGNEPIVKGEERHDSLLIGGNKSDKKQGFKKWDEIV
jgi:hypothetical protein